MRRAYWRIAAFALIGLSVLDGGAVTKVEVVVSPSLIYLRPGQDTVFQALVVGAKAQKVIWSASQGTITSSGVYTAGASGGSATITARWAHDRKQFGNATATRHARRAKLVRRSRFVYSQGSPPFFPPTHSSL